MKIRQKRNNSVFFICVMCIALISCSSQTEVRVVEETWGRGQEKTVGYYVEKGNKKELVKQIEYYENGQKKQEGSFKNGLREGEWTFWYDNGNVWSKGVFVAGKSHGKTTVYHPNGQVYYEGKYAHDKPVGTWVFYDEEGRWLDEKTY